MIICMIISFLKLLRRIQTAGLLGPQLSLQCTPAATPILLVCTLVVVTEFCDWQMKHFFHASMEKKLLIMKK